MSVEQPRAVDFLGRDRRWSIVLAVLVLLLYLLSLNSHWRFQRDSSIYMGLGRSLIEGNGYVFNGAPHGMYPPGYPAILGAVGYVVGMPQRLSDSFLAFNALQMAFALGSMLFFAAILAELRLSRGLAFTVLFLWCVSRSLYYFSVQLVTDVPFTFFALAAIWCGMRMLRETGRHSYVWCAACALLVLAASAIRASGPLLIPAVMLGLWVRKGGLQRWSSNTLKSLLLCAFITVPLLIWLGAAHDASSRPHREYFRGKLHWGTVMEIAVNAFRDFPDHMRGLSDALAGTGLGMPVGLLMCVLLAVGLVRMVRASDRLLSAYTLLTVAAVLSGGWPLSRRYLLPVLPVLLLWLVLGGDALGAWLQAHNRYFTRRRMQFAACLVLAFLVVTNLTRISKIISESRSSRFYAVAEGGRGQEYATMTDWLRRNVAAEDTILCYEAGTVHYFTRIHTLSFPTDSTGMPVRRLAMTLAREHIRYMILDPRKDKESSVMVRFVRENPGRLTTVFAVNGMELMRLDEPKAYERAAR